MVYRPKNDLSDLIRMVVQETFKSLSSIIDVEARHGVSSALQTITSHERICEERDKDADKQRTRMEAKIDDMVELLDKKATMSDFTILTKKIDGLYKMAWVSVGTIIAMFLGLSAYLIRMDLFPGN